LETAHPAKFLDVMEEELGEGAVAIPKRLGCLANLGKDCDTDGSQMKKCSWNGCSSIG
jgi:threonine synthase